MTDLYTALAQRSPRERRLLALLVVVGIAGLAFAILAPLREARLSAEARVLEERALQGWVQARTAEFSALAAASPALPEAPTAPIGTSGIEESLIAARLRNKVSRLSAEGDGRVSLAFDTVEFTRLMTWLSGVSARWGYQIEAFSLARTAPEGSVQAELSLAPRTP
ncbi:type II secretion system protein M [Pseudoruegeria sp. SHC-113]|uniref:type II secretion system protein M n=1 Tax=Pseudoruegeria sp. SHC-113 TaxID=2855439 RepID=UPI0021BA402D|nr:type II secretion system protein M [Pseudoruegeria sp. SHC-113]MCT8161669.1 type II secretion system protein M [Pseudoruegeria sp. SHC-113]